MSRTLAEGPSGSPRLIFFGGTFDPPHLGHVGIIKELRRQTGQRLVVVPTGIPGHRPRPIATPQQRAEMVDIAVRALADEQVSVCRWEVEQNHPCFTIDTVERWLAEWPETTIELALGSDVTAGLPTWKSAARLMTLVRLLVFERGGAPESGEAVLTRLRQLGFPVAGAAVIAVNAPTVDATRVRERLARGERCDTLLPAEVGEYIRAHGLYRPEAEAAASPGEG